MGFIDDYEPVENRIRDFWAKYEYGRIITNLQRTDRLDGRVEWICRTEVYTADTDTAPRATGNATEIEGSSNINKVNASENCETSSIGRALANLGFATKGKRPSREEMSKVARAEDNHAKADLWAVNPVVIGDSPKPPNDVWTCNHGERIWANGVSVKSGKAWGAYRCTERDKTSQCEPIWYILGPNAEWKVRN